jgi:replicative DNA helicase
MKLFSVEAEQALIGGLLLNPVDAHELTNSTNPDWFYDPFNRAAWKLMCKYISDGIDFDWIAIATEMKQPKAMEKIGVMVRNSTGVNLDNHARIIKQRALRRSIVEIGQQCVQLATSDDPDSKVIDQVQSFAMTLSGGSDSYEALGIKAVLSQCVENIDKRINANGLILGLESGFHELDKRILGYQPGDFVIIAGRPSMGKTNLALNIVQHNIMNGKSGVIFSLEMPKDQLAERMIASAGISDYGQIRAGNPDCLPSVTVGISNISPGNLTIYDKPAITTLEMTRVARKEALKYGGLDFVIIDYLQLMTVDRSDNRTDEIGKISRSLKRIAKELECPVFALSQLNRGVESRPDKRPRMSDLRESGDIEQDADIIHFIYRDEVYNEDSHAKGLAEVITSKFRAGETGRDFLRTDFRHCRFMDFDGQPPTQEQPTKKRKRGGFDG